MRRFITTIALNDESLKLTKDIKEVVKNNIASTCEVKVEHGYYTTEKR